jgi:hypothetical protein
MRRKSSLAYFLVNERAIEIGLLVALGFGLAHIIHLAVPTLPGHTLLSFVLLAEGFAITIGLRTSVLPASNAALLDPVEALRQCEHVARDQHGGVLAAKLCAKSASSPLGICASSSYIDSTTISSWWLAM